MTDPAPTEPVPAASCPECGGEQLTPHPAGLVFAHNTVRGCSLQDAEDSRALADRELATLRGWPFTRETTSTERTLLAAAGYTLPVPDPDGDTDQLPVVVDWLTTAVRRRRWPDLESPDATVAP